MLYAEVSEYIDIFLRGITIEMSYGNDGDDLG